MYGDEAVFNDSASFLSLPAAGWAEADKYSNDAAGRCGKIPYYN